MDKIWFRHSPFRFRGSDPTVWLVLDCRRARSRHTKQTRLTAAGNVLFFAHMQATKDPVGTCLLGRKNNFVAHGWNKETASSDNKEQGLDHQDIVEVFGSCQHLLSFFAPLFNFKGRYSDSVLRGDVCNRPDPKWSSYPFISISNTSWRHLSGTGSKPNHNCCNKYLVILIWLKGISFQPSWDWYV